MKKTLLTSIIVFGTAIAAHAQDGLAIGGGYRGFLNRIFMNENALMCSQNGFYLFADYNCEKLIGPIDVNIGIDIARLWYLYIRPEHGVGEVYFPATNNNLATLDLQVPLRFRWTFNVGDEHQMFIQAGPVFDLGLTLRDGTRTNVADYRTRVDLYKSGNYPIEAGEYTGTKAHPQYFQCDCFIGGGVGFIFGNVVRLMVNADWGCVNKLRDPGAFDADLTAYGVTTMNSHNVQLNVSLAYCFE